MSWRLEGEPIDETFFARWDLLARIDIKNSNLRHQWETLNNILNFLMGYFGINNHSYIPNCGRKALYWLEHFMINGKA